MRSYEVIFILDPALGDDGVDTAVTAASGVVTREGGEVAEVQKWGKKRLAYEIKKRREGHYVFLRLQAPVKAVSELERHLNIAEPVLKFLTVVAQAPQRKVGKGKMRATALQEAGTHGVGAQEADAPGDVQDTHNTAAGTHGSTVGTHGLTVGIRQTGAEVQEA